MKARHSVRIISGTLKGRRLSYSEQPLLRPSKDSTREMLFSWLMHSVVGANCLDLFAGSGAFGIEALSRGARHVTFIENNRVTTKEMHAHLAHCLPEHKERTHRIIVTDALKWLSQSTDTQETWDIVFCDPPFRWQDSDYNALFSSLGQHQLVSPTTLVYLECAAPPSTLATWRTIKHKTSGSVHSILLQKTL